MPPYGAKVGPEGGSTQASATEALLLRGPGLKIEGDHAPTWRQDGPRGGSTQASATEALLLPGPRVEDRRRPCPHMAPRWAQKGGQPRPVQLRLCCSRGPGLKIEGDHAPIWRQDGPRRGVNQGQCN